MASRAVCPDAKWAWANFAKWRAQHYSHCVQVPVIPRYYLQPPPHQPTNFPLRRPPDHPGRPFRIQPNYPFPKRCGTYTQISGDPSGIGGGAWFFPFSFREPSGRKGRRWRCGWVIWKQESTIITTAVMAAKDYAAQQNSLFGGSIIAIDTIGDNVICASRTPVMARCHRFATSGDCCFVGAHFSSQIIFYARESAKLEGFICDSTGGLGSIGSRVSKSTLAFYRRNEYITSDLIVGALRRDRYMRPCGAAIYTGLFVRNLGFAD